MRLSFLFMFLAVCCLSQAMYVPSYDDGTVDDFNKEAAKAKVKAVMEKLRERLGELQKKLEELKSKGKSVIGELIRQRLAALREKLGKLIKPDEEERFARDMQTALGKVLETVLQGYIKKLHDLVDHGKKQYEQMLVKAQDLLKQLEGHAQGALEKVKNFITEVTSKFIGGIIGKRDLEFNFEDDMMDELVRRGLIDYFRDTFGQIIAHLKGKFQELGDYFRGLIKDTHGKLRPHLDNIRDLAKQFLGHLKGVNDKVAQEALKFFQQYKNDLGGLWQQIQQAAKDIHKKVTGKETRALKEKVSEKLKAVMAKLKERIAEITKKLQELKQKGKSVIAELIRKRLEALKEKLGKLISPEEEERFARDMQTALGKVLETVLQGYIKKLHDLVDHGKKQYGEMLAKAEELLKQLEGHAKGAIEKVKNFITEVTSKFLGGIIGKRDLEFNFEEDMMNELARRGLIDYIRDTFGQIIAHLKGKFQELGDFFRGLIKDTHGKLRPHLDNIRDLAKQFLGHLQGVNDKVAQEALKFFQQYKNDLGGLWQQIQQAAKDIHKKVTGKETRAISEKVAEKLKSVIAKLKERVAEITKKLKELKSKGKSVIAELIRKRLEALKEKLGKLISPEEEERFSRDMQTALGKVLESVLQGYIKKLHDLVDHGKKQYAQMLVKAQELLKQLEGHAQGAIEKVKNFITDLTAKFIGGIIGKRNLEFNFEEDMMNELVRRGLIDYIRDTFGQIISHLKGKFKELGDYFRNLIKDTHGKLRPHLDNIRDLAKQFLGHLQGVNDKVAQEALKFFQQYKNDLGGLWQQIQQAAKDIHKKVTGKETRALKEKISERLKSVMGKLKERISVIVKKLKELKLKGKSVIAELIRKRLEALKEKLGKLISPEEQERFSRDMQTALGKVLESVLQGYIKKLHDLVDHGKKQYEQMLVKAQELLKELEGHAKGAVDKVKNFITDLTAKLIGGIIGKRDLEFNFEEDMMNELARRGLIDYIRDTFGQIIAHLKGKFRELGDFFRGLIKDTHGKLRPHLDNIRDLAKQFLGHLQGVNDKVAQEALKFFQQYKNDLGGLWQQIQQAAKDIHKKVTGKETRGLKWNELQEKLREKIREIARKLREYREKMKQKIGELFKEKLQKKPGVSDEEVERVTREMQTAVGKVLSRMLKDYIQKLHDLVDHGKKKYQETLEKAQKLAEMLKQHAAGAVDMVKKFFADILKNNLPGFGKRDLEVDFSDALDDLPTALMTEMEKRGIIDNIIRYFRDTISQIVNHMQNKFIDLKNFFKSMFKDTHEQLKPHVENIKTLAKQFLTHLQGVNDKIAQEALKFFKQYKNDLGGLWQQIQQAAKEIHAKVTGGTKPTRDLTEEEIVVFNSFGDLLKQAAAKLAQSGADAAKKFIKDGLKSLGIPSFLVDMMVDKLWSQLMEKIGKRDVGEMSDEEILELLDVFDSEMAVYGFDLKSIANKALEVLKKHGETAAKASIKLALRSAGVPSFVANFLVDKVWDIVKSKIGKRDIADLDEFELDSISTFSDDEIATFNIFREAAQLLVDSLKEQLKRAAEMYKQNHDVARQLVKNLIEAKAPFIPGFVRELVVDLAMNYVKKIADKISPGVAVYADDDEMTPFFLPGVSSLVDSVKDSLRKAAEMYKQVGHDAAKKYVKDIINSKFPWVPGFLVDKAVDIAFAHVLKLVDQIGKRDVSDEDAEIAAYNFITDMGKMLVESAKEQLDRAAKMYLENHDMARQMIKNLIEAKLPIIPSFVRELVVDFVMNYVKKLAEKITPAKRDIADDDLIIEALEDAEIVPFGFFDSVARKLMDKAKQSLRKAAELYLEKGHDAALEMTKQIIKAKAPFVPSFIVNKAVDFAFKYVKELAEQIRGRRDLTIFTRNVEQMQAYAVDLNTILKSIKQDVMDRVKAVGIHILEEVLKKEGIPVELVEGIIGKRDLSDEELTYHREMIVREMKTEFGKLLEAKLQKLVQRLHDLVDHGKKQYAELLKRAQELIKQLQGHTEGAIGKVKEFIKEAISQLVGGVIGKREIQDDVDDMLYEISEYGIIGSIKDTLKQIVGRMKGKFADLREWFKQIAASTHEKLKPHMENVKEMAKQFIERIKTTNETVRQEALKFFRQYKNDLGDLWNQIKKSIDDLKEGGY